MEPEKNMVQYSIREEMVNRGIVLKDLSRDRIQLPLVQSTNNTYLKDNMGNLLNQDASIDEANRLTASFIEPVDLGIYLTNQIANLSKEQIEQIEDKFLSDDTYFIAGEKYRFHRYSLIERAIYFRMNAYQNHRIVDGTAEIKLYLNDDLQASNYVQTYQDQIKILDTNAACISEEDAFQIINNRVETYLPDNSRIELTNLSYYRVKKLDKLSVYAPVWEIIYIQPDGTARSVYVEARRGTILSPG